MAEIDPPDSGFCKFLRAAMVVDSGMAGGLDIDLGEVAKMARLSGASAKQCFERLGREELGGPGSLPPQLRVDPDKPTIQIDRDKVTFFLSEMERAVSRPANLDEANGAEGQDMTTERVRVFISHRATDVALATALINCLESCLEIPEGSIRCTSVPGYKLDIGDDGPRVIRDNLRGCDVVVGLITEQSLESAYVIMELGAAWGLRKRTCPVVSTTILFSAIPAPIGGIHCARPDPEGIGNLVDVLARDAGFSKRNTPKINAALSTFAARATELAAAALRNTSSADDDASDSLPPAAMEDAEAVVRLKSWIKNDNTGRMNQEIRFAELDKALNLAPGMAAKHLVIAASARHDVEHQSPTSVLFKASSLLRKVIDTDSQFKRGGF